jgi:hypothetical protein
MTWRCVWLNQFDALAPKRLIMSGFLAALISSCFPKRSRSRKRGNAQLLPKRQRSNTTLSRKVRVLPAKVCGLALKFRCVLP